MSRYRVKCATFCRVLNYSCRSSVFSMSSLVCRWTWKSRSCHLTDGFARKDGNRMFECHGQVLKFVGLFFSRNLSHLKPMFTTRYKCRIKIIDPRTRVLKCPRLVRPDAKVCLLHSRYPNKHVCKNSSVRCDVYVCSRTCMLCVITRDARTIHFFIMS